jgi:hypothetical protein
MSSTTGGRYAAQTSVSAEKSRAEIERTLTRYGATAFAYMTNGSHSVIMFEMAGRRIRFLLPLPEESAFRLTPTRRTRTPTQRREAWAQATRQRWRALALIIKAKLEAIEAGVSTLESEFLAQTMLPSGATVGEWLEPQLDAVYDSGRMPPLLLGAPESDPTD